MIDFQKINLTPGLKFTLKSMPRGNNYKQSITNTCELPFKHVTIDANLDCFLCGCDGWLPIPVGKISEFNKLSDIWESPIAKMLQNDIAEKKFTWCAVTYCGITHHNRIKSEYSVSINIDDSCNLACPSCRRELRMLDSGPEFESKIKNLNHIMHLLEQFEHPVNVYLGGSGDALASHIIRHLIQQYRPKPGQSFEISTNGLLIKKLISDSPLRSYLSAINISVDAASAEVYEKVRRPGKWKNLLENIEWLADNRGSSRVTLSLTVQKTNFRDIPAFDDLCHRLNFSGNLQALSDWGTWNSRPVKNPDAYTIKNGTYIDHDVANPTHPEHTEFLTVMRDVYKQNKNLRIPSYFEKFK